MDVHATGPNDGLQFGALPNRPRDWQPADAGQSHDGNEPTHNCGGSGTPPAQAEHDRPALNDRKHIETKPADQPNGGTNTSGGFIFALRSAQQGTTDVEAWFESDDDIANGDVNDGDPTGTTTITWTGPTPTQTPTESETSTPTPTESPTSTATATTSPTATRSPTATTSPTATRSPTTSPTTSPTATTASPTTTTTSPSARTITLETSRSKVTFGARVAFSGVVNSNNTGCESGQTVRIQRQTVGAEGFSEIGTATTDPSGTYAFSYKPDQNATYRAVVDPSAICQEATSSTRAVLVRVKVGLKADKRRKGRRVELDRKSVV